MKNSILLVVIIILIGIYIFIPTSFSIENNSSTDENIIIFDLDIEEYIIGVVAAEMPASFSDEALKAQAIASRSYAVSLINDGIDITTDVSTQSYITIDEMIDKWGEDYEYYYEKIKNAVYSTENLVLKSSEEVITAFYFAISNGYTAESSAVFSESLDYIESVESLWDISVNNYEVTTEYSYDSFCELLTIECQSIDIEDISYSDIYQVESITINGESFSGTEFRELLSLRSTTFSILLEDNIYITTKGYGHGVGMSQYGANEMAKEGYTYDEILLYYYKDVEISNI